MAEKKFSRRKFIVRALVGGTGVLLGATYLGRNAIRRQLFEITESDAILGYVGSVDQPSMWFEIIQDNTVRLVSPKVEMGQGVFTGLAQIAADELEVDIDQLEVVHAPTATGNIDGLSTGGSTSIAGLWMPLRELAATMREMLKVEAARKMGVDAGSLTVEKGVVSGGGKSMTYGEIVEGVTEWEVPDTPPLKDIKDYQFVGKPVPRVDLVDKVIGKPIFGMDAQMPDMLYGAVVRPSKIGATYLGADTTEAEQMPGVVKVVKEADFVGVVATSQIAADNAKRAIKAEWEVERNWQTQDIQDMILIGKGKDFVVQKGGNAKRVLRNAEADDNRELIVSEYRSPIGAHAQLEPNGAVAFVEEDKATVMISTQVVGITRAEVAKRLGMDEEQVNIIPTYLGGGFGRRLHTPNAIQAAVLSKAVGKPVKCFFDRKEEFQQDTFRPPTHHRMRGTLDGNGNIEAIEHSYSSGDVMFGSPLLPGVLEPIMGADGGAYRGASIQYRAIPNYRTVAWNVKLPFATSWWRSLGLLANTFAIESFMDELAVKAGKNPVQFRLDHIQDDEAGRRLKKVIQTAAERSNYQDQAQGNRAMGFAASTDATTPVAHVAEVSVTDNRIKVEKVTCVIDPGMVVNPDQVKAQCEGCVMMGISAAMFERMYVEDGELQPIIYGSYRMALMRDAPSEIDVVLLENGDKPGPVGEPPLGPIGAAIANAVFRATGQRLREMPLELG